MTLENTCEHCKRPDDPNITNWVTGHHFVGWGHGWQPCPYCYGSTIDPKYAASVELLVGAIRMILPLAVVDQGLQLKAKSDQLRSYLDEAEAWRERQAEMNRRALDLLGITYPGLCTDKVWGGGVIEGIEQLKSERDALIVRRDELLVTIKNLSLSTPYAEEAPNAATLIAEVGTLRSKLREVEEENARLRARFSGRDPRSLDE